MYIQLDGNLGDIFFTSCFHYLEELTKCLPSPEKHQGRDHRAQIVALLSDSTLENWLQIQL
jgi:hypothetical protein